MNELLLEFVEPFIHYNINKLFIRVKFNLLKWIIKWKLSSDALFSTVQAAALHKQQLHIISIGYKLIRWICWMFMYTVHCTGLWQLTFQRIYFAVKQYEHQVLQNLVAYWAHVIFGVAQQPVSWARHNWVFGEVHQIHWKEICPYPVVMLCNYTYIRMSVYVYIHRVMYVHTVHCMHSLYARFLRLLTTLFFNFVIIIKN